MLILKRSVLSGILIGMSTFMVAIAADRIGFGSWVSPVTGMLAGYAWVQFWRLQQEWKRRRTLGEQVQDLASTYGLATDTEATLQENLASLAAQLHEVEARSHTLQDQLDAVQPDYAKATAALQQLQERYRSQAEQVSTLRQQATALAAQNADLTAQVTSYQQLQPDLTKRQAEVAQLRQEIANQRKYVALVEDELERKERGLQDAMQAGQNAIQDLLVENTQLRQQLGQQETAPPEPLTTAAIAPSNLPLDTTEMPLYHVEIRSYDDLHRLSAKELRQVLTRIFDLQHTPRPHDCKGIKKYRHYPLNLYRIRSGGYRICYSVEDAPQRQVRVLMIDNRREGIYDDDLGRRLGY